MATGPHESPIRFAVLLTVLAFGLFTVPAAGAAPKGAFEGAFSFTEVEFSSTPHANGSAHLFGVPVVPLAWERGSWEFRADAVVVRERIQHGQRREVLGVFQSNYSSQHETRETRFGPSAGRLVESRIYSYLWAVEHEHIGDSAASLRVELPLAVPSINATDHVHFRAEDTPRTFNPQKGIKYPQFELDAPNILATSPSDTGTVTLTGNFTLRTFDSDIQFIPKKGEARRIGSGYFPHNGHGIRNVAYVSDDNKITLFVGFTNAVLTYRPEGRPLQVNFRSVDVEGHGDFRFEDATGRLRGGNELALAGEPLRLTDADLRLVATARKDAGRGAAIDAHVSGHAGLVDVNGRRLTAPAPSPGGAAVPFVALASAGGAVAALGWLWLRRRGHDARGLIEAAERSLLRGRFSRVARLARRASALDPANARAVLLRSAAELRLGRPRLALDVLDAADLKLRGEPAGVHHLTRSSALFALGEREAAMRELATAIRLAPSLKGEIEGTELQAHAQNHWLLRSLVDNGAAAYA